MVQQQTGRNGLAGFLYLAILLSNDIYWTLSLSQDRHCSTGWSSVYFNG